MTSVGPTLALRGVGKSFAATRALDHLDLDVATGATTVLIGPSGCGKSTILRLMIGLVWPDAGSVEFEGEPIARETLNQLRRRMGYVIQEGGLFPHLTAGDNVTLMAGQVGWPAQRIAARLTDLAELVRLPRAALDRYPLQLSGGQRQRVSLMRALMLDPAVLLLDEPLGALDPMVRAELQEDLRAIFRAVAKTVVLVTHDLAEAAFFADSLVLLRDGRIVQQGAVNELLDAPADSFVSRFVSTSRFLSLQRRSEQG